MLILIKISEGQQAGSKKLKNILSQSFVYLLLNVYLQNIMVELLKLKINKGLLSDRIP